MRTGEWFATIETQLTIQPGVEVRFLSNYVFEVVGILRASGTGTENRRIVFTTTNAAVGWKGIFFNESRSNSVLRYCRIERCRNSGVRIKKTDGNPIKIEDCEIMDNESQSQSGGGVSIEGNATLSRCWIVGNRCPGYQMGGGVAVWGSKADVLLENCRILGNSAGHAGGGVAVQTTTSDGLTKLRMVNCIVRSNSVVDGYASGVHLGGNSPGAIVNCTIIDNRGGPGIYMTIYARGGLELTNSIVWGNSGQIAGSPMWIASSCIQGWTATNGIIIENPSLDPVTSELLIGSPCIDAGSPDAVFYDVCFPPSMGLLRNDMGAFGGPGACCWGIHSNSPAIITRPQPQVGCPGSSASFSVTASTNGGPLRYQWFQEDMPLDGQTGRILSLSGLDTSAVGHYSVMVSNDYAGISATAVLSMYEACVDLQVDGIQRRLSISGPAGTTYVLKYTTDLSNTDYSSWTPLATNTMGGSSWFYLDMVSPFSPTRFYGVKIQP